MGNNQAFTSFEQSVMSIYKRGKLDKALLSDLMEPYRGMDIDIGGKIGITAKEPKTGFLMEIEDVVIRVFTGKYFERPKGLPKDYNKWTQYQRDANDKRQEDGYAAFKKITSKFGWC